MAKKRILVIDDDENLTRLLKISLEESGSYEVQGENHPDKALSKTLEFNPDLILLDVILGDIDGGEVASQIKEQEQTKNIPIIFLTGAVTEEETQGGTIGGYPFIAKPVSTEKLIKKIETTLSS